MQTLLQDLRYGVRMLLKRPGFVVVAVFTLALGIGATTTVFSALDALILRPFSFANQERLVMVYERKREIGMQRSSAAPGNLNDWRTQSKTFADFIAMRNEDFDLQTSEQTERFTGYTVTTGFFEALGVQPLLGRGFTAAEGEAGHEQVVVLKHSLWQQRFGANPNIVGQMIQINGKPHQVLGVMPPDFDFPYSGGELWTPLMLDAAKLQDRGSHYVRVMGLLKSGVSVAAADTEIRALMQRSQQLYPATNSGVDAFVVGLNEDHTRHSRSYLVIMLGAVFCVLLIACANVANLLLVRATGRQKELAVRMALGASRWRVMRQMLTESLLLSLLGGIGGLLLAYWGVDTLAHGVPEGFSQFIPGWSHLTLNRTALFFTLGVSFCTGVLFGLLPAWQATQTNFDVALKDGNKGAAGGVRNRWRNSLVVGEIALSLMLLIGAGLLLRSFIIVIWQTDFGFNPAHVISLRVVMPKDRYKEPAQRAELIQQLIRRTTALPGVVSAGAVDNLPLSGNHNSSFFQIVGQPPFPQASMPSTDVRLATPSYFAAIGTPLRTGRFFTEQDNAQAPLVALVNEAFAARYFLGRTAIGERLNFGNDKPVEIIGIVANVMNDNLDDLAEPSVYQPHAQWSRETMSFVVRGELAPTQLVNAIRQELTALDPNLPISHIKTMDERIRERSSPQRVITVVLGAFALIALVLATVGLYAVMSYAVAQRTNEIGIRMALGAHARDVFRLVLGQGLKLTLLGLALGLLGAFALSRVLSRVLFGITATDGLTFTLVVGIFALVAGLACYIPARRATKVDPMVALRCE